MTRNVYTTRRSIVKEFLTNPRDGVRYHGGRMYIRESPDGNGYQLVAYGDNILAEIEGSDLRFYIGHHGQVSRTTTGYIKKFGSVLSNTGGLRVDIRDEAPTNGYIRRRLSSTAAQYIGNYVDYREEMSAVEEDAVEAVEEALADILALEFGDDE